MSELYHYGQGKVEFAVITNGVLGEWIWLGDVSELTFGMEESKFAHKESYSGLKKEVREIGEGVATSGSMTIYNLGAENVARFTNGTLTSTAAGTATAEGLGTVTATSVIQLAHMGVSDLVITDSTASPATIAPTHYSYDEFGELKFNSLPAAPAPTMPLKAAYSYSASKQAAMLTKPSSMIALRYKGVNLAEDNKPCLFELYKVSPSLMQTLSLITTGQQLASAPIAFKALADTSKPANGALGQYGRLVTLGY